MLNVESSVDERKKKNFFLSEKWPVLERLLAFYFFFKDEDSDTTKPFIWSALVVLPLEQQVLLYLLTRSTITILSVLLHLIML